MKLEKLLDQFNFKAIGVDKSKDIKGVEVDSRRIQKDYIFITVQGEKKNGVDFAQDAFKKGACLIVVDEKNKDKVFDLPHLVVDNTLRFLWDISSLYREEFNEVRVIAITGSVGKTAMKDLIAHFLKIKTSNIVKSEKSYNNFIGVPLTLTRINEKTEYLVCELGSNHKGEISKLTQLVKPDIGVLTKIGPSHLEFLESLNGVLEEKSSLFKKITEDGLAVLNENPPLIHEISDQIKCRKVFYNINKSKYSITEDGVHLIFNNVQFFYPEGGYAFAENLLGALTLINSIWESPAKLPQLNESLRNFKLPPLRMEKKEINGITYIMDCYNANPLSLENLLRTYKNSKFRKFLVLGDMLELGSYADKYHRSAAHLAKETKIYKMYLIGEHTRNTYEESLKQEIPVQHFESLESLKKTILKELRKGDIVLVKGSRKMKLEEIL